MKPLPDRLPAMSSLSFGADPEIFLVRKRTIGKKTVETVIGAEHVLLDDKGRNLDSQLIVDGVAAEINIDGGYHCREQLGSAFFSVVKRLRTLAERARADISFDVSKTLTVSAMRAVSARNRVFGCKPTFSAYDESLVMPDGTKTRVRSAGGHIHIGMDSIEDRKALHENAHRVVRIFDIIVGNTLVLIDRDPGNAIRREVYGRAGEYRLPAYGLEYRVPSNFWLKHINYVGLVFGLATAAMRLGLSEAWSEAVMSRVDEADIRQAINENNFDLALSNYKKIKDVLRRAPHYMITSSMLLNLEFLAEVGPEKAFGTSVGVPYYEERKHSAIAGAYGWQYNQDEISRRRQMHNQEKEATKVTLTV